MKTQGAIAPTLANFLDPQQIHPWGDLAPSQRQKFSLAITPETKIEGIAEPTTAEELAQIITCADQNRWKVLPCGNASKIGWGALTQDIDLVVSVARLNRLIEHAAGDMTVTVEAGMPFEKLQTALAGAGQFLPLDPLYANQATLGGIVATASTGSLRQRYGGVRDLLLGISFVRTDGKIAKAGGRVVKNVAGYDLMKLFTGSYGTLGILSQLTFRVYALPETSQTLLCTGVAEQIHPVVQQLLAGAFTPTALDVLSPAVLTALGIAASGLGLVVRFQTIAAGVGEQVQRFQALTTAQDLHCQSYTETHEQALWQQLREIMERGDKTNTILCKMGVKASTVVETLTQIQKLTAGTGSAWIQAGSGVGYLRLEVTANSSQEIARIRQLCHQHQGFLTVLEAPVALKQQLEVWGYAGNALELMRKIKQQFDPKLLLSPCRSFGGL